MIWFSKHTSGNTIDDYIAYLKRPYDQPESYSIIGRLHKAISKRELTNEQLKETIKLKIPFLNMRISTRANTDTLQMILDLNVIDQSVFANMLYNKGITKDQELRILELCDDSPRGIKNRQIIEKRHERNN